MVGENHRIVLGSTWVHSFSHMIEPVAGKSLAKVVGIPSSTDPFAYDVQLWDGYIKEADKGGQILKEIASEDATEWAIGDWVLVEKVDKVWRIADSGLVSMEDTSDVVLALCQVRPSPGGKLILEFSSADDGDESVPHITLEPDASTTFRLFCPPQLAIPPHIYQYDIVFYRSGTSPYDPVFRQYGDFEIVDSITRRT